MRRPFLYIIANYVSGGESSAAGGTQDHQPVITVLVLNCGPLAHQDKNSLVWIGEQFVPALLRPRPAAPLAAPRRAVIAGRRAQQSVTGQRPRCTNSALKFLGELSRLKKIKINDF